MSEPANIPSTNSWMVEELYQQFIDNPDAVPTTWHDFFSDYRSAESTHTAPEKATEIPGRPSGQPQVISSAARVYDDSIQAVLPHLSGAPIPSAATNLRGAAKAIAANMVESLTVPTATSFREIPAKLLEVNRRTINAHLNRTFQGKVSFTQLLAWAVVRALKAHPGMRSLYGLDQQGNPWIMVAEHVNLGIAVDVERKGVRSLVVPNIKAADTMTFAEFWAAYEQTIRRVMRGDMDAAMFEGTTHTLTNPGGAGTATSVPRLMAGQSAIIGVGAIDFPGQLKGSDPATMAELGISKIIHATSTYDHRVIQGAESGMFLATFEDLLLGGDGFYDEIFKALRVPYHPLRWTCDAASAVRTDKIVRAKKQAGVQNIIASYRTRGHLTANTNPLEQGLPALYEELDPLHHNLTIWDLDRTFPVNGLAGHDEMTLRQTLTTLRDAYCRTLAIEYMHNDRPDKKRWWQGRLEGVDDDVTSEDRERILMMLNEAEAFERFLGTKYLGQKRFSLEGAESLIPMLDELFNIAADDEMVTSAVIGMAHRGRLNVLANILNKDYDRIFGEFEDSMDATSLQGSGDVKYHLGQSGVHLSPNGNEIPVTLAANPSHLEAVNPVVEGIVRGRMDAMSFPTPQDTYDEPIVSVGTVLPVLVHGDSAFIGQGVVAETIGMSRLEGYHTGGTIHIIVNNQIGFTTAPERARSSVYASDMAKIIGAPVLHVNGDDPEACVRAVRHAMAYRERWHADIVIDMVCYRRHGHNESDEPAFTQPQMYERINAHRSVRKVYTDTLLARGELSLEEAEANFASFQARLDEVLSQVRDSEPVVPQDVLPPPPPVLDVYPTFETGVSRERLDAVTKALLTVPDDFNVNPKLQRLLEKRASMLDEDAVDWPMAELLAFGTILQDGQNVRIAGQDVPRATFSQRHAAYQDVLDGTRYIPLQYLPVDGQPDGPAPDRMAGQFLCYESPLNEYACLGFEYGYSLARKDSLVVWEAQFGDFANGAQIIIDQFVMSAWHKWKQVSGLVMLLPHGYEGQGPEHSSARIERFLTMSAQHNVEICQPSSAASYFHLLRRHMAREPEKRVPLIVFSPKSMLRSPAVCSTAEAFISGRFKRVRVEDADRLPVPADQVKRVLVCSGKVSHTLDAERGNKPVAIVRVEQLYPWPAEKIAEALALYPNASEVYWVQDEPENQGPWPFVRPRLAELVRPDQTYHHVTRVASPSPATGSHTVSHLEEATILAEALSF